MRAFAVLIFLATCAHAATDVRVDFTLDTKDSDGEVLHQQRRYSVYRPDNLPRTEPLPMVLVLEASPGGAPAGFFHRMADQGGFLVVSCSFSGNSTGTPGTGWNASDPRVSGYEDHDYLSAVINRVRASDNGRDAFIAGLSKGGHMSLSYACVRPQMLRAAASVDEFMGLTTNVPTAQLPILMMHGTLDTNVPYTMVKDTLDAWLGVNGLVNATPVTTYEASPRIPGMVSQATWRNTASGLQAAFVTVIGGTHTYPTPGAQTGYDCTAGIWAFFSQFLTPGQGAPRIVAQPVDNVQAGSHPASFHVVARGAGPLRYQWQRNGVDIPGATAMWYTALADSDAKFQVVVSNATGSANSRAASLTVRPAPAGPRITVQPADQSTTAGHTVSFQVSATGAPPLRYQWQKNGMDIGGPSVEALTMDTGASFSVVVSNVEGSVVSNAATLTVTRAAGGPVILTNPARARVQPGQRASFSVTAKSSSPLRYQWQKGTINGNMADIPGATGVTYSTPLTTLADHHTLLRCTVSNAAGSVTSASEMLFVTAGPGR